MCAPIQNQNFLDAFHPSKGRWDKDINDVFQNNIIFITVLESPNVKVILETMWEKIVQKKRPEFQNVEETHKELQQQLLRQAKSTPNIIQYHQS